MAKERVYNDAEDKNVAVVKVFADSNGDLYYDAAFRNAVEAKDCLNLFYKGVVAVKSGTIYAAQSCTDAGVINFGF